MIYSIFTEKGGVGKTALVVNMAYYLNRKGYSVLMVDYDPQANLTLVTGQYMKSDKTLADVLMEEAEAKDIVLHTEYCGDLLPASHELSEIDPDRSDLAKLLEPLKDNYDFILVDNNPSEGRYIVSSIQAAERVIIPIEGNVTSVQAIGRNLKIVEAVKNTNPDLKVGGFVVTMYDDTTKYAQNFMTEMRRVAEGYEVPVYDTMIRYSRAVRPSQNNYLPLEEYSKRSGACRDYEALVDEIIKNELKGARKNGKKK